MSSSSSLSRHQQRKKNEQQLVIRNAARPTKRQRRLQPLTPIDHESLGCVASPHGPISTPVTISTLDKELILERLQKEIVQPFHMTSLSIPRGNKIVAASGKSLNKIRKRTVVRYKTPKSLERTLALESRLAIGTNQCTRALESDHRPVLVLLCRDVHPPTMMAHVPLLCRRWNDPPLVLLPGRASLELGKALGIPRASIVVFSERREAADDEDANKAMIDKLHHKIDSYIDYVKSKLV